MRIKTSVKLELALTFILFVTMILMPPFNIGIPKIGQMTGHAIAENIEEVQTTVQTILRDSAFGPLENNAKICVNVINNENETFSFKIRKRAEVLNVEPSEHDCEGKENEDFIFSFNSYDSLLGLKDKISPDFFFDSGNSGKYIIEDSKYFAKSNSLVVCNEEFEDKYCDAMNTYLSEDDKKSLGINCCNDPDEEMPAISTIMDNINWFFINYWWLVGLIVISTVLGISGVFLMTFSDDDYERKTNKDIAKYIKKSRKKGFTDTEIRKSLLKVGWNEDSVDNEFDLIREEDISSLEDRFEKLD